MNKGTLIFQRRISQRLISQRRISRQRISRRTVWARRTFGVFFAATLGLFMGLTAITPVFAQDAGNTTLIRKIDATNYPKVTMSVLGQPGHPDNGVKVTENGKVVANPELNTLAQAGISLGVVLVIDTSDATTDQGALDKIKVAAHAMIASRAPNEKFAIVTANTSPRTAVPFTSDAVLLNNVVDQMSPAGSSAMWSAVQIGSALLAGSPDLQANMVVISASPDTSSGVSLDDTVAALRAAKAVAFPIGIVQLAGVTDGGLRALASGTGGPYVTTSDPAQLTAVLAGVQAQLVNQQVVSYTSPGGSNALDVQVAVGASTGEAKINAGGMSEGANVNPAAASSTGPLGKLPLKILPGPLAGYGGIAVVAVIVLLSVGLFVYATIETFAPDKVQVSSALRPYSDKLTEDKDRDFSKLYDNEIIKKAVAQTERFTKERGLFDRVQTLLEQANLPLRPAEGMLITFLIAIVAMIIALIFFGFLGFIAAGAIFCLVPPSLLNFLAKKRRKKFTSQLPDTLALLAGSLRAGYSLVQGLDAVSKQCDDPMGGELGRAMAEARLGRPVEVALQEISDRMGSADFEWTVMAIKIQREVGGNLAELLMTVADTMVQRERLRREVSALTAEGRVSSVLLAGLPFAIGGLFEIMNPAYMEPLWHNFFGQVAVGTGIVAIIAGWFIMRKLIDIEA